MSRPDIEHDLRIPERALGLPRGIGLSRWFLRRVLSWIAVGHLTMFTPEGERFCSAPGMPGPQATMLLNNWRSIRRLLLGGDIGLAEAYRDGDLHTPDLTVLIELGARNDATLRKLVSGAWPARLLHRLRHVLNANTPAAAAATSRRITISAMISTATGSMPA